MSKIPAIIEEREERIMHGWMRRDASELKRFMARDCVLMFATDPPEILDRPSLVAAMERDFRCLGYRFGDNIMRRYGKLVWFTAPVDLELKIGVKEWKGRFLLTDLWRKYAFGGWKVTERSLAPLVPDQKLSDNLRRLQMWQA
ncbi:MAG: nuclear transport factor 2 family protein [Pseudomonadota bacterium]